MIVSTDKDGRIVGTLDSGYPAQPEVLQRVRETEEGLAYDIPPFTTDFWYIKDGVPTVRPILEFSIEERIEDMDTALVVTGVPAGVLVIVRGPEEEMQIETDDEELVLVLRTPGEYTFGFDPFPFQPVTRNVRVSEKEN